MPPTNTSATLLDELEASYASWKYGPSRNAVIIRFCSALVSVSASLLLVWIVLRSRPQLTTTYHRLVVGMSCADVFMSTSMITFSAAVPRELGYYVWNARGDEATCTAVGFAGVLGASMTLLQSCSISIYYLAQIKYELSSRYISKCLEPWLHAIPIVYGLSLGMIGVANNGINVDKFGDCFPGAYSPPHCDGYDDGVVPGGGFEIPCGRGRDVEATLFVTGLVTLVVPVIVGSSLWMVYKSVLKKEKMIREYVAESLDTSNRSYGTNDNDANVSLDNSDSNSSRQPSDDGANITTFEVEGREDRSRDGYDDECILYKIMCACKRKRRRPRISPHATDAELSRILFHRAAAYSLSYFVTWVWFIIYIIVILAGEWPDEFPPPKPVVYFNYVWNFFNPLQGFWNFLIYLHPKAVDAKFSSDRPISWFVAFARAFALAVAQ